MNGIGFWDFSFEFGSTILMHFWDISTWPHSFIQAIAIAHLQVHYYSEALLTLLGYCVGVSHQSATGNCE